VFGDAIVPRGGSVWLGTLLNFSTRRHRRQRGPHRDVAIDRRRLVRPTQGRPQQLLPLGEEGRQTFDIATKHIYDRRRPTGPGGSSCC